MRWFWHPFVAEIQLLKTKLFKETNSADSFAKVYTEVMRTLDFVKMVEYWQWMVFCEHGSRNIIMPSILQPLPSKHVLLEEI